MKAPSRSQAKRYWLKVGLATKAPLAAWPAAMTRRLASKRSGRSVDGMPGRATVSRAARPGRLRRLPGSASRPGGRRTGRPGPGALAVRVAQRGDHERGLVEAFLAGVVVDGPSPSRWWRSETGRRPSRPRVRASLARGAVARLRRPGQGRSSGVDVVAQVGSGQLPRRPRGTHKRSGVRISLGQARMRRLHARAFARHRHARSPYGTPPTSFLT